MTTEIAAKTAKHTPGPWKLETVRTSIGVCHKIGTLGAMTKLNHACLYDDCYSEKPGDLQLLADARLIASAPDLLEAAKRTILLIATVRNICGDKTAEWLMEQESYKLSVAAIAKAEGR